MEMYILSLRLLRDAFAILVRYKRIFDRAVVTRREMVQSTDAVESTRVLRSAVTCPRW